MRFESILRFSILAIAASGCQLIAGVKTDGKLASTTSTSTGVGGGSTTTSTASTGTGGAGGKGQCTLSTDCPTAFPACVQGSCVVGTCDPGAVFSVADSTTIGGHKIRSERLMVTGSDNATYLAFEDDSAELWVSRLHSDNTADFAAPYQSPTGQFDVVDAAVVDGKLVFGAEEDGVVGVVSFDLDTTDGFPSSPTFIPFDTKCSAAQSLGSFTFTHTATATKYVATCDDASVPQTTLIVGGSDETSTVIATGAYQAHELKVDSYDIAGGVRLISTGGGDSPNSHVRYGKNVADLATDVKVSFAADLNSIIAATPPLATDDGFIVEALSYTATSGRFDNVVVYSGVVHDPSVLGQVPPPGLVVQIPDVMKVTETIGDLQVATSPLGPLVAIRGGDHLVARIGWLAPTGEVILFAAPVITKTASDDVSIDSAAVSYGDGHTSYAWTETPSSGMPEVKATSIFCSSTKAP